MEFAKFISPVEALIESPVGVAVNVPPEVKPEAPVGVGFVPSLQTGEEYEKLVTGGGLVLTTIVTLLLVAVEEVTQVALLVITQLTTSLFTNEFVVNELPVSPEIIFPFTFH